MHRSTLALAIAALLGACSGGQPAAPTFQIVVTPAEATIAASATLQLAAGVSGAADAAVAWSIDEAGGGSVTGDGVYTAPSSAGVFRVRATSSADPTRSALATITVTVPPPAPTIASFTATPSLIAAGSTSTLAWSVSGATAIAIDQGIGAIASASATVSPDVTTTYTLTASNAAGSVTAQATVTVLQKPSISSFAANPATIGAGQSSTLSFAATGATALAIDRGVGAVSGTSQLVTPATTTTYTLTATNAAGSTTATTTVTVVPLPTISSFAASPAGINAGGSATLSWTVAGASGVSIDHGVGAVTGTTKVVTPADTTTYTLTATGLAGSATAQATVTVLAKPTISNFTANPPVIGAGQSSTLSFAATGADTLSIDQGVGALTGTSKLVTPGATTTYTLTATNAAGSTTAQATVTVVPLPTISSFAASPAGINSGGSTTLSWTVAGASGVSIDNGIGAVTGSSKLVTPAATTTYTLTATSLAGSISAQTTVTVLQKPTISSFTATPSTISSGGSSTLSWTVAGAASLSLDNAIGTVTGTSASVSPSATTTYTLSATNAAGTTIATATVTVAAAGAPVIASFGAAPAGINVGGATTLSWSVTGATSLSINNAVGTVTGTTSKSVSPAATTTYTLTASNASGSATALATVTVLQRPVITNFSANPTSVGAGQPSTLSFGASGADTLSIDQGVGAVTGTSKVVTPAATTTYTLTATNAAGSTFATATVTVVPLPTITSFAASPANLNVGGSSTLSWSVSGASSLSIDNAVGVVTGTTSKSVTPSSTTTYTLTATSLAGSVSAQATVTVLQKPVISSFSANPTSIGAGQSSTLSFAVTGATSLSIDNAVGVVTGTTSKVVTPAATTTYTLSATNAAGTTTATATVTVVPLPTIASFAASPANINVGASTTLSWSVSGASSLSIDNAVGVVTGTTSKLVTPSATTTYTLTATSLAGSVTAQATVTVLQKPVISSFTTSPATISSGASSTLAWTVTGATSLSLDNSIGAVTGTSKAVSPTATTTYKLTATNAAGSSFSTTTVTVTTGTPPAITSFTATPSPVASGGAVTLTWSAASATGFSLDNGIGAVTGTSKTVNPTASTTYQLTASSSAGSAVAAVTVTVQPAASALKPTIDALTADALVVPSGGSGTTLRWTVANATSLSIDSGVGSVNALTSKPVAPAATTTYTLTAGNAAGTASASITVAVGPAAGSFLAPGNPGGTPAVTFTLDSGSTAAAAKAIHPISRFIYGYNANLPSDAPSGATYLRLGGNRWTAYNWENNASNAGSDYFYQSDDFLGGGNTPGEAIRPTIAADQTANVGTLVTLPMEGWVAADKLGTSVSLTAPQTDRFFQTLPRKAAPFSATPDTSDRFVYQDEYVHSLLGQFPTAFADPVKPVHFSLDNEPDLWTATHKEIQRIPLTYASLIRSTIDLSSAVKDVVPGALVFGPVSYGFNGFVNLQNATDADPAAWNPVATSVWFLDSYLQRVRTASEAQGRRLVDALDLHWYSEASNAGSGRVTDNDNSAGMRAARVQAPRSLWDPTYSCITTGTTPTGCEDSWVANYFANWATGVFGPIQLIRTLNTKIASSYPGTKLAFTEYNHGGGNDISGAVAEVDTLGIFGREGVYAATYWPLLSDDSFTHAAFRIFRNYDGAGGAFGDTSLQATSTDDSKASVYASMDAGHPERLVVVVANKTVGSLPTQLRLTHTQAFSKAQLYQVTANSPATTPTGAPAYVAPQAVSPATALTSTNALNLTLPASSVTTVVLLP